uniref:Ras and EF-hand domain-containing protein-like n=1 Tax=Sphaeramia orbicularis TaxID=375764 RepID=A0A673CKG7_9TELE
MERPGLRRLFSACDVNKSGAIEYDDFTAVCRELNVPETEIQSLFDKFDPSKDGYIDYSKFSSRFQEVSETLDLASLGAGSAHVQGFPWEELVGRQLEDLYQSIQSSANMTLLQQYEDLVRSLISQSVDSRLECEQLETSLRRAEEMNNSQLAELEDDIQQQLTRTEDRVRDEERKKMEGIVAAMQTKHKNEVADLHAALDRLLKVGSCLCNRKIKQKTTEENEHLRASLVQAQTNIAILHSELDKLKNMYADQKTQHQRETDDLRRMVMEYQSYSDQIQILQEMNKKLYDSNDGLRTALAGEVVAAKRRLSPQNEIPARRMKPLRQSTLNHSSKMNYSHVATWADKYLDSGVSLPMDTADNSGSDYDSDDSRNSVETVHCSYSDVEVRIHMTVRVLKEKTGGLKGVIFKENEEPAPMYRLVLAGDAGAGKSSFLLRLTLNEFRGDIQTTLGVDFQIKRMLVDGEKTSLQIWDTAGQERFRSIARSYFRKAHGVLLLYDVTSESSFLNVRAWVDQIQESSDEKIPMCVIGNKVDLRDELPEGSCVSSSHGEKLAKAYSALFCETSAKEGTNVVEAVLHLAREVKKNVTLRRQSNSQVRLNQTNRMKTLNGCCGL